MGVKEAQNGWGQSPDPSVKIPRLQVGLDWRSRARALADFSGASAEARLRLESECVERGAPGWGLMNLPSFSSGKEEAAEAWVVSQLPLSLRPPGLHLPGALLPWVVGFLPGNFWF